MQKITQDDIDAWKEGNWFRSLAEGEYVVVRSHWAYNHEDKTRDEYTELKLAKVAARKIRTGYFGGSHFDVHMVKFKFVKGGGVFWSEGTYCGKYAYYIEPLNFTNWKDREADTKELLTRHFFPANMFK